MLLNPLRRTIGLAAMLLTTAIALAAELPRQGLLSIGRTATPPQIDALLDDDAWQDAIALGPFMLANNGGPAREQTTARLCYDDQFLFLAARAEAFCLQPEANQLHAFQMKATAADDEAIIKDDCLVFIISPNTPEPVMFDFFINARGAVLDSRGTAPDFWSSRDRSWNAGIRCQAKIEHGYWIMEAAIPLAALGLSTTNLPVCRFLLGRLEKRSSETSAWQRLSQGLHADDEWSQLHFTTAVPAVARIDLPEFRSSHNLCSLTLDQPWPEPVHWQLQRTGADGKPLVDRLNIAAAAAPQRHDLAVRLQDQTPFTFQASLHRASGEPLLATPLYAARPAFTDLVCLDPVSALRVNGRPADSRGTALKTGANRIEVEAAAGQSVRFALGLHQFTLDDSWRQEGKVYRKTLFLDQTVLWPNWKAQALHLAPGQGQQLLFWPNGLPDTNLKNGYKLTLEVPKGCSLLGASGYYNLLPLEFSEITPGDDCRRYEIAFPKVTRYNENTRHELHRWCAVFLMPDTDWDGRGELRFYASSPDRNSEEIPQRVPLRPLSPVQGRQPASIMFQLWTGWLRTMSDTALRDKIYASFIPAGITEASAPAIPGLKSFSLINFETWNLDLKAWLAQGDDFRLLQFNGERHKHYPCSGRLLHTPEGRQALISSAKAWQERAGVDHCNYDFEGSVWGNHLSCFCPFCLDRFAQANAISAPLTPEILKSTYEKEWIAWMTKVMADITVLLRDGVKSARPDVRFSVYTGYQSEDTQRRYGVNWELLSGKIDLGMCGYGYNPKLLQATRAALAPTPMVSGVILHPYTSKITTYPSAWSQAEILQHLLVGRVGVLFYDYPSMDARSFFNIGEISRLAADYESLILNGERVETEFPLLQGPAADSYQALRHAGQTLLLMMNRSRNPLAYALNGDAPALAGKTLRDWATDLPAPLQGEIPAGGIRVLRLE